jgi:hypothetical protein
VGKTHERNDLPECGAAVPDGAMCRDNFHAPLLLESEIPGGPGSVAHFYAVATYGLQVRKACQVFHPRVGERVVVQVDQGQLLEAGQMFEFRSRLSLRLLRIQQQTEIWQHGQVQTTGATAQSVAMVAVVLLEDVVDPLLRQGA